MKCKVEMIERLQFTVGIALLIMIFLCGCSSMNGVSFSQMSAKEKATYMLSVYNSQYADYMIVTGYTLDMNGNWEKTSFPSLTEEQKAILRNKKEIMIKVYPLIRIYNKQIQSSGGGVVSRDVEQEIMKLLNQL
jgi:hypothetical protein